MEIETPSKYKRSRQREKLLELLRSTGRHPTADWLYNTLKPDFPKLSVGTVYRNLTILIEQGLANRVDFGGAFDRFEANTTAHYHFICECCGSISDLEQPIDTELNERVARETPFIVRSHRIVFYGVCDYCIKKKVRKEAKSYE